jgi:hypothetical protein
VTRALVVIVACALVACAHSEEQTAPQPPPPPIGTRPPNAQNVPPFEFDQQALFRPDPHLTDRARILNCCGQAVWAAKVCIGNDGAVSYIRVFDYGPPPKKK